MHQEPVYLKKRLANLVGPIFVETLLFMLLGAVDTVMLGLYSDNSVAAVGVVNQILGMIVLVFEVTSAGTSILCSQYLGAGQRRNVVEVIGVSLLFNACMGGIVSWFLFFHGESLLRLMELRPELMPDGMAYMRIVGGFIFLQSLAMTLSAILRSAGKAYYPMRVTLVINIVNMIGNYLLIFGSFGFPPLGVAGAALSTSFSRGVAMLLLALLLFRNVVPSFPLAWFRPFPWRKLKQLLSIGMPAAGEQISYSLSQLVITYFTNMLGNEALTARTYAVNIIMFSYLFAMSMGLGGAICIGHLVGEGHKNAAYQMGRYCMRLALIVTFSLAVITALAGRPLMGLITSNAEVISLVSTILIIDVVLELGRPINIVCVNALRATGDVAYPFIVGLIVMWGVATAFGYVFGIVLGWGLAGMWVAFTLDEGIRAVVLSARWRSRKWEKKAFVSATRNREVETGGAPPDNH